MSEAHSFGKYIIMEKETAKKIKERAARFNEYQEKYERGKSES